MTGADVWAAEAGWRNSVIRTQPHASSAAVSYFERKTVRSRRWARKCGLLRRRLLCSLCSDRSVVYVWYIFYSKVDIAPLLWINFNSFQLLILLLDFTGYFQRAASLPKYRHLSLTTIGVSTGISATDATKRTFFFRRPVCRRLSFMQMFCVPLSIVDASNIAYPNFQVF